MYTNIYVN